MLDERSSREEQQELHEKPIEMLFGEILSAALSSTVCGDPQLTSLVLTVHFLRATEEPHERDTMLAHLE
jgi:hypothetical protein